MEENMKKKIISLVLCVSMLLVIAACGGKSNGESGSADDGSGNYEIGIVTDLGQLMEKGFYQGTYEGAME